MFEKIHRRGFWIRLRSWEYWPFGIIQFPAILYWLFLSLKHRSLIFFSASNPGIVMGGMFGESKFEVLSKIPDKYRPKSILVKKNLSADSVRCLLAKSDLNFPLIFKPDLGERGHMVQKIQCVSEIDLYVAKVKCDFIAQELVAFPLEFGVFYVHVPGESRGRVTSVVGKEMLAVVGDGTRTIAQLIFLNDRATLQWKKLRFSNDLARVPRAGERVELVSIGNHALGTKFLDCNYLINDQLNATFDAISRQIDGFFYGRFDLRCSSVEDLYQGRITILELNGCGAEPAHIYQPGYPLFKAIGVLLYHWHLMDRVASENRKRGYSYATLHEARTRYKAFKEATSS